MTTCKTCGETIESATLHACRAPSLHAPWLSDMLATANKPLLDELSRIRELLEGQQPRKKQREGETQAARRETR